MYVIGSLSKKTTTSHVRTVQLTASCVPVYASMLCCLQGYLSVNYSDNYYKLSQRFEEVPRLTPAHYEAMALFNELAKCAPLSACAHPSCLQP